MRLIELTDEQLKTLEEMFGIDGINRIEMSEFRDGENWYFVSDFDIKIKGFVKLKKKKDEGEEG